MDRLSYQNEWFDHLPLTAMNEGEFERILCQHPYLFCKNASIVPFKLTVSGDSGRGRPDLAIIDNNYRWWWVVEVELERHDLYRHVIPQVRCFQTANYGLDAAEYIIARNPSLDQQLLFCMMKGEPPRVVVIVDKLNNEWEREIKRYDASLISVSIYRSRHNRYVFGVGGFLPSMDDFTSIECSFSACLPRTLVVHSPAALPISNGEDIPIYVNGDEVMWNRWESASECYLTARQRVELKPKQRYRLVRAADNTNRLEKK